MLDLHLPAARATDLFSPVMPCFLLLGGSSFDIVVLRTLMNDLFWRLFYMKPFFAQTVEFLKVGFFSLLTDIGICFMLVLCVCRKAISCQEHLGQAVQEVSAA